MFNKFKSKTRTEIENFDPIISNSLEPKDKLKKVEINNRSETNDIELQPSIISEGSCFNGDLQFPGALHLNGTLKGSAKVDRLIISKSGNFDGSIEADSVTISGTVKGEIICRSLIIRADSKIRAKIFYEEIEVQRGSIVHGLITRVRK
jgi:cytoskeletal protein CcmA (bactofilin family)